MSRARPAWNRIWPRLAAVAGVLGVWWGLSATGWVDHTVLPTPATAWTALWDHVKSGKIPAAAGHSLIRLAFGMVVAVLVGTAVGTLMAASAIFQRSIGTITVGLQALPPVAWLPLAILWLGFTERAVVFVVVLGAFPAVAMATAASIRQVSPILIRAGRTLGAKGWTLYRHVVVPAAVPGYLQGLRQAWVFAWWSLMAGELIVVGGRGLGHALNRAGARLDAPTILALMVVIVVIGLVIDLPFAATDRRVRAKRGLVQP